MSTDEGTDVDELDDDQDHDDDNPAAEALGTLSELIRTAVREELTSWDAARQPPKSARKRKPAPKPEPEPAKPPTILDQLGSLFRP